MDRLSKYARGISPNARGRRGLTAKDKEKIRKGRKGDVDHKKPVALHKKQPVFDLMNNWGIDVNTSSGRPPKHSYDRKNNLQLLSKKQHKKKTKQDMKDIIAKRRKELDNWGLGKIDIGI